MRLWCEYFVVRLLYNFEQKKTQRHSLNNGDGFKSDLYFQKSCDSFEENAFKRL